ncbi:5-exo-hydroxycamphor dehydrogenase [Aspergillus similis]
MRRGKVAVLSNGRIDITTESSPSPQPDELLVHLVAAGICGSDVHRLAGDIAPIAHPICFGHEAVGVIQEIGDNIKEDRVGNPVSVGDMVYWCPVAPCGSCQECASSNIMRCQDLNWPAPAGYPNAAGFREYASLNKCCIFIRVPQNTSPLAVIAFGCAMPTATRRFAKLDNVSKDTAIIIQGAGPVGLACTLLASLAGARIIIVIGDPAHRLTAATSLGATHVLSVSSTTVQERAQYIDKATAGRGADVVIEAAGVPAAFSEGFDLLGPNGQYLILGLYSGKSVCAVDPVRINNLNLRIIGSLGAEPSHYHQTIQIADIHAERVGLSSFVTHTFPLKRLEEAIETVRQGTPIKAVVTP